jgi:hypothetical protein
MVEMVLTPAESDEVLARLLLRALMALANYPKDLAARPLESDFNLHEVVIEDTFDLVAVARHIREGYQAEQERRLQQEHK